MKKVFYGIILFVILLGVPLIAKLIAFSFDYSTIDSENVFLVLMIRHTIQVLFILCFMFIITRLTGINFNFTLGNKREGLKYLKKFMLIFSGGCLVFTIILFISSQLQSYNFTYTLKNIAGYLGFQLLFTGPSEEIIFRAFAITIFATFISQKSVIKKITYANLFSAIVFGLAHISISFAPFKLTYALPQIIFSIVLGLFYGDCYEKSKSILYPIIMHSFSNVVIVSLTLIFTSI